MNRQRVRWILYIVLGMLLAACGTSVPRVTPTVAPTLTPSPEPTGVAELPSRTPVVVTGSDTPTPQPSVTATATATQTTTPTPQPTDTPSATATGTQTPTATASATRTPLPPTATHTPTVTHTPSVTPLPLLPSDTPTLTLTPTLTPSASPTLTQTFTPAPPTATSTPQIIVTERTISTPTPLPPTFTAVPQASPTRTLPPPTLPITPTLITATPGAVDIQGDAITSTPEFQPDAPTATPFTPTPLPFDRIPPTVSAQSPNFPQTPPDFSANTIGAYTFDTGPGQFSFNGRIIGGSVGLFEINPADSGSYARTNTAGLLSFVPPGQSNEQTIAGNPFFAGFGAEGLTADTNKNYISDIAWSPNGQNLAFIISPPPEPGIDRINAGVYFWSQREGRAFPMLRDCPDSAEQWPSCDLIAGRPAWNWQSEKIEWSPDSTRALITLWLPRQQRRAVVVRDTIPSENAASDLTTTNFWRYDSASWIDNDTLLVSGRRETDGRVIVGTVDSFFRNVGNETIIFDASANGLWLENAVQRDNGEILALGRPSAPDGPLRLYRVSNGNATPISEYAGAGYPERVEWARNKSQVVLTVQGQQYVINASGSVEQVLTGQPIQAGETGSNGGVAPVGERENTSDSGVSSGDDTPPAGVVAGSAYSAGQQLRHIGEIPRNMRAFPNLDAALVGVINPGEFVSVLAGPHENNGFFWWRVSNARNVQAWVAVETVNGVSFFTP